MRRFTLYLTLALLLHVLNIGAQSIVVDRGNTAEEMENVTGYPVLDKQLRLSIDGGFSYRIGKAAEGLPREYIRKMRPGVYFGADLLYFPTEMWGIGAKYLGRKYNVEIGSATEKVDVHYFAPMAVARLFDRKHRNAWVMGLSLGYIRFTDKLSAPDYKNTINKGGIGSAYEIGYDIRIAKRTFFGLKFSITSGYIIAKPLAGGEDQKEDTSSIDISAGLRF